MDFVRTKYKSILFVFSIAFLSITPVSGSSPEQSFDWICIPGERVGPITSRTSEDDLIKHIDILRTTKWLTKHGMMQ